MITYMMNPAGLMQMSMYHGKPGAMTISVATFVLLAAGIFLTPWPSRSGAPSGDLTFALGKALMGPQMLTMMTLGFALFATIVATVVLATDRGRYHRFGDDLRRRPADDPVRGGVGR
jgi:NADH-quinone oxidoreductase subunit J